MKLNAELLRTGANTTGIEVPQAVLDALGGGKRPRVEVVLNGFSFTLTLGSMGGRVMIPVSAERRQQAGVTGGETYEIDISVTAAPRAIELPDDLAGALAAAGVTEAFEQLAPSQRKEHVRAVNEAKAPETRARRIAKTVEMLSDGR